MTEDFKMYAKDWLANTITNGSQGNYKLFYNDYWGGDTIYQDFDVNAVVKCYKQVVSPKNVGVMWTIFILWSESLQKGRFVILDENFTIVSLIDEYTSGANIGCYYCLDLDEKGRLYGVEYLPSESRTRFIMLNNISIPKGDEYYADIRKTYDIPTLNGNAPIKNTSAYGFMIKKDSKYGIVNSVNRSIIEIYSFEINVDSPNVWKGAQVSSALWTSHKPYMKFDNNNMLKCKIIGTVDNVANVGLKRDTITEDDNGLNAIQDTIFSNTNGYKTFSKNDIWWIDENNFLMPFKDNTHLVLETFDLTSIVPDPNYSNQYTGNFQVKYTEDYYAKYLKVKFASANSYCFMYAYGYDDGYQSDIGLKESIYHIFKPDFSDIDQNNNIYELVTYEDYDISTYDEAEIYLVNNQYNLYNHSIMRKGRNELLEIYLGVNTYQEIYNENNYNKEPYITNSQSSMIPKQFILKSQNQNQILLARDIYNKTAYGNIIDISLQIPNNLVNNVEINNEQLWSSTKEVMNNENKSIIKNKYEELILNIRNRLNVVDNNNELNLLLQDTSNTLSQAMAGINNYTPTDLTIKKAKLNYTDNTTDYVNTTSTKNGNTSTITFDVEVTKSIKSIELVSDNFSFITLTPTLEVGKSYTISQDIRIGD